MKPEDVEYFAQKQQSQPAVFDLAQRVYGACSTDPANKVEIQRRFSELSRSKNDEHLRQSANLVAELIVFSDLLDRGLVPKWLPESAIVGVKAPDIEYAEAGRCIPVEVKHLNDPRDEHIATYQGRSVGGSVDPNYSEFLEQKVAYLVGDAQEKFAQYTASNEEAGKPKLYVFFTKSVNAEVADIVSVTMSQFDSEPVITMAAHIKRFAQQRLNSDIDLTVEELRVRF